MGPAGQDWACVFFIVALDRIEREQGRSSGGGRHLFGKGEAYDVVQVIPFLEKHKEACSKRKPPPYTATTAYFPPSVTTNAKADERHGIERWCSGLLVTDTTPPSIYSTKQVAVKKQRPIVTLFGVT